MTLNPDHFNYEQFFYETDIYIEQRLLIKEGFTDYEIWGMLETQIDNILASGRLLNGRRRQSSN
jgi:hypothetical protein